MREEREITHIFVAKKTNKQTNKQTKKREKLICIQKFEISFCSFSVFLTNSKKKTRRKIIYIFFILLSSLINSSTCGERVEPCILSRSKQSINDNVISNFPKVISNTVYVANNVHIAVRKSFNGR
jgi:hypothetical protein